MRTRLLLLYLLAWGIAPRLRGAKALASVAPPPKADDDSSKPATKPEAATPKVEAPPPPTTRPREAEPAKKKGKKGDGEP